MNRFTATLFLIMAIAATAHSNTSEQGSIDRAKSAANEIDIVVDSIMGKDLPSSYIVNDNELDKSKALLVASVYHKKTSSSTFNYIPYSNNINYRNSIIVLNSLTVPGQQYYLSGVELAAIQIPAGEYYISSIRAGTQSDSNWIARISVAGKDSYSNYAYLKVDAGETIYLGHINTHHMRKIAIPGRSPTILHPKYAHQNKPDLATEFFNSYFPSLAHTFITRTFDTSAETIAKYRSVSSPQPNSLVEAIELESQNYISTLKEPNYKNRIKSYKTIFHSWSNDPTLYNYIQQRLIDYLNNPENTEEDEIIWATKTLAGSGIPRYTKTFTQLTNNAKHRDVQRWATKSLSILQKRQVLTPLINDAQYYQVGMTPKENRIINMIKTDMDDLQLQGAKTAYKERIYSDVVMAELKQSLLSTYQLHEMNKYQLKKNVLICKIFLKSKNRDYIKIISTVSDGPSHKKLKKYATKIYNAAIKQGLTP